MNLCLLLLRKNELIKCLNQNYWGSSPAGNIYEEWVSRISDFMNAEPKYKGIPIADFLK